MKILLGKNMKTKKSIYSICLEFQPRDAWIGLYIEQAYLGVFIFYLCILPFFPIHIKRFPTNE